MTITGIIVALVLIGLALWLINTFIPMDQKIKTILNVVVIIFLVLCLLHILLGFSVLTHQVRIR